MERLQTWWVTELYPSKDEDNFGIAGDCEVVKFTDAQAIIAALQSEVKDLKEWLAAYKQSLELAQSSLTQRTAERDTARRRVDELEAREVDVVLLRDDLEQRTAELEAAKRERDKIVEARQNMLQSMANWLAQLKPTHHPLYRKGVEEVIAAAFNGYRADKSQPVLLSEWQEQQIRLANPQAELERVRGDVNTLNQLLRDKGLGQGEIDGMAADLEELTALRTLIAALPKVEGEIMVSESLVLAEDPDMCSDMSDKDEAMAYAALLKHRQGMEG